MVDLSIINHVQLPECSHWTMRDAEKPSRRPPSENQFPGTGSTGGTVARLRSCTGIGCLSRLAKLGNPGTRWALSWENQPSTEVLMGKSSNNGWCSMVGFFALPCYQSLKLVAWPSDIAFKDQIIEWMEESGGSVCNTPEWNFGLVVKFTVPFIVGNGIFWAIKLPKNGWRTSCQQDMVQDIKHCYMWSKRYGSMPKNTVVKR